MKENWPSLSWPAWKDSCTTLHLWLQIIGKIKTGLSPFVNHWWNVALYVTSRGLTTSPIPFRDLNFQMDLDFINHALVITTTRGDTRTIELKPRSVADFYNTLMSTLRSLGIEVSFWTTPVEISERIPFETDNQHSAYDPEYVNRHWRVLVQADRIMKLFRSRFIGKASPVHFFWGSFDMAASRFSGRTAPPHPGSPNVSRSVMLEAYSHEVYSCGFWAGAGLGEPAFYAYAYPVPQGYKTSRVQPEEAYYNNDFGEFILPYEAARSAPSPDDKILSFFQSTYEAAANLARWDRAALERHQEYSRSASG